MKRTLFIILTFFMSANVSAQYETPVAYMNYLTNIEIDLAANYMSYMSAMAHTNNGRKMERRRLEVISTVKEGRAKVAKLKAYEREVSLRDAYSSYLLILQAVLGEDYAKIVDLEEIAEQSYDKMEAYMLAQEKANDKLHIAADSLHSAYRHFAEKNNVKLVGSENKVSKKLEQTSKVMSYYNQVYLIHFKCLKQEVYMIDAMNTGDVNGIEQNKSTLIKYSVEGLDKLKKITPFEGDYSIVISCRKVLEFYKNEAEKQISGVTDYLMKKEEFAKFKKGYDTRPQQQRTQQDVESFNALVTDMNKMGESYNKINNNLNSTRTSLTNDWNNSVKKFLDTHIPN